MFDVGFWEVVVIGVVALLVFGPERLPELAQKVGRWVRYAQNLAYNARAEIEREFRVSELRDEFQNNADFKSLKNDINSARQTLNQKLTTQIDGEPVDETPEPDPLSVGEDHLEPPTPLDPKSIEKDPSP